jgi:RNA polymerase sigma-70 factor, ECF subfamily
MGTASGTAAVKDPALVARLRRGEAEAFEYLVRHHGPQMLAVTRRVLREERDAHEALRDAFGAAFRGLARLEAETPLASWLRRLALSAALQGLLRRPPPPGGPIDELLPGFLEDGHHARHPVEWLGDEDVERSDSCAFVRAAIDRLPESFRIVLVLRDVEGLETAELARALGLTDNLVKSRLHRARQALRTLLEPRFGRGN